MNENLEFFLEKERQVWEALRRGDLVADASLLADDFLGVYESGFGTKEQHVQLLRYGPTVVDYKLEQPRLRILSSTLALLSYAVTWRRTANRSEEEHRYYISSAWECREGGWLNIFSQDTREVSPSEQA